MAVNAGVRLLFCDPCIERVLLEIAGKRIAAKSRLKQAFLDAFGKHAHAVDMRRLFDRAQIEKRRREMQLLDELVLLLQDAR